MTDEAAVAAAAPQGREISQREFCDAIAQRLEAMLTNMTGKAPGAGPAFALLIWTDGHPAVDYACNRGMQELGQRLLGVIANVGEQVGREEAQKAQVGSPLIVRPH